MYLNNMKVNIPSLQQGGGFKIFSPYVKQSLQDENVKSSKEDSKVESPSSIIDEDLYKQLVTKGGLVNDVNKFVDNLMKYEKMNVLGTNAPDTKGQMLQMLKKVNELKVSKEMYTSAVKNAQSSEGWSEVAVSERGGIYVKDASGNVLETSVDDYKENSEKYSVLSVAGLMNERQYNPKLAEQNNVFNVANTSIGLNKIISNVKELILSLGSEKSEQSRTMSRSKAAEYLMTNKTREPNQVEKEGLDILKQVAESEFSHSQVSSVFETQKNHINSALSYIWKTLGTNAQNKLIVTASMNGEKSPLKFLQDMLISETDESKSIEIKGLGDSDTELKNKVSKDSEKLSDITPFELFHNGKLGKQIVPWNDPSSGKTFNLTATGVSRLMTIDGKPIGGTTLQNVLNSENGSLVDTHKVFFGDKQISLNDLNSLVYDGGLAMRVYAPVNSTGGIDYYKLEELKKIEEKITSNKDLTPEQINEMFKESGFSYVKVDEQKQYVLNDRFKPFLMFTAYGTDEMDSTKNNSKIKALSGDEEDYIKGFLDKVWSDNKVSKPVGKLWTDYYKGMIAIPYITDSSIYAGSISKNIKDKTSTLTDVRLNKERNNGTVINASSNSLW